MKETIKYKNKSHDSSKEMADSLCNDRFNETIAQLSTYTMYTTYTNIDALHSS